MNKELSVLLHTEWWEKCRTCKYWNGADVGNGGNTINDHVRWLPAKCENPASPMYGQETWTEGYCPKWDSFDVETALEVLEASYNEQRAKESTY